MAITKAVKAIPVEVVHRGRTVLLASTSLPTAQAALTVYVVAVGPGNILH